jgi:Flp pilus assembly protein TadB
MTGAGWPGWLGWLGCLAAAGAVALAVAPRARLPAVPELVDPADDPGWLRRHRLVWSVLAGIGAAVLVGGPVGLAASGVAAVSVWTVVGRAESPVARAEREACRRDLPAVVTLLAAALRAGADPGEAVAVVAEALPGPAASRLTAVASRLRLGGDPASVWAELGRDPELAALGRTLARAQATGAPVVTAVERLAVDLARAARGGAEDRARAIGVKAAVPLGLCLLPAFVLIGIVPLVAALMLSLDW